MNVICYGDSNTYGYDPRSFWGERYEADCRWVDIIASKTGWNIINDGMNGREIPRVSVWFPDNTDLLLIMLGTNDLLQGCSADITEQRMDAFLCKLVLPKDRVLLVSPPPFALGEWVSNQTLIDESICLAIEYSRIARKHGVRFIDAGKWNIDMAYDGVHFSEAGHKQFADGLLKELLS